MAGLSGGGSALLRRGAAAHADGDRSVAQKANTNKNASVSLSRLLLRPIMCAVFEGPYTKLEQRRKPLRWSRTRRLSRRTSSAWERHTPITSWQKRGKEQRLGCQVPSFRLKKFTWQIAGVGICGEGQHRRAFPISVPQKLVKELFQRDRQTLRGKKAHRCLYDVVNGALFWPCPLFHCHTSSEVSEVLFFNASLSALFPSAPILLLSAWWCLLLDEYAIMQSIHLFHFLLAHLPGQVL